MGQARQGNRGDAMSEIRILVTGFSAFPRAPVNPTQVLMEMLAAAPPDLGPDVRLRIEILPVEYQRAPDALMRLGSEWPADVAVHFGLAANAKGFRLESTARNRSSLTAVDAAGLLPASELICEGPATLPSSLPLKQIRGALEAAGLPVQMSTNAGAYLCNHVFYLSRAGTLTGFAPAMSGFIHVPFLDEQLGHPGVRAPGLPSMSRKDLLEGARMILQTCAETARAARHPPSP